MLAFKQEVFSMVKPLFSRPRLLGMVALAVLALCLLIAVAPGHPVVHAQRAASASQADANTSTVAISVTIGANTGQTFAASHVALGGQSAAQQGTGTGGQGPFTASPIGIKLRTQLNQPIT